VPVVSGALSLPAVLSPLLLVGVDGRTWRYDQPVARSCLVIILSIILLRSVQENTPRGVSWGLVGSES